MRRVFPLSAAFLAAAGLFATLAAADPVEKVLGKIEAALPASAPAKPKAERNVLIFSRTAGFRHDSIETGIRALTLMGEKTKAYTAFATEDESFFAADKLKKFDAVVFLNTTENCLNPLTAKVAKDATKEQKDAAAKTEEEYKASLKAFVEGGKGLFGIHAATDTYKGWKDFNVMMGGAFESHPWTANMKVGIKNIDPTHPLNAAFDGKGFEITDEIYQFKPTTALPGERRYLLTLDAEKTNMKIGTRKDGFYPVSWLSTFGKGRTFYCSLGHRQDIYWNTPVLTHYLAGLQYALGDLDADAKPTEK